MFVWDVLRVPQAYHFHRMNGGWGGWGDWIKGQIWGKNWAEGKEKKNGEGVKVYTGWVDGTGPHAV